MEKVLLFRMGDEEAAAIADLLAAMRIRCERIPESAFRQTIGALAAGKNGRPCMQTAPDRSHAEIWRSTEGPPDAEMRQGAAEPSDAEIQKTGQDVPGTDAARTVSKESLMLFCDVGEKHFNRALALLRSRAVRVDYKAVLTPTNREWNVLRLYAELAREKAEYERMKG